MKLSKIKKLITDEVISLTLTISIIVTSFFNFGKLNKNKPTPPPIKPNISNSTNIENTNKPPIELIQEIESIYTIDFSSLILPNSNTNCTITYELPNSKNIYDKTTELVNQIKTNTINYIKTNPKFISGFVEQNNQDNSTDQVSVQNILKDAIYNILKTGSSKDVCLLQDLKVVISYDDNLVSNDTYTKYYPETNLLIIFPNNIRNNIDNKATHRWETLKYSIQYELNIARQQPCKCQNKNISFPYETLSEASIISELYNFEKIENLQNTNIIDCENLILALGLFNPNSTITNYYNAIFNNDINALYDFCGITNDEEAISKLNKILYTMDIINNYKTIDNISTNSIEEYIGYDYKAELFGMIINNMISYTTQTKDFTLQDNLIIYNIIKNLIITDINTSLNDDAINNIATINNIYTKFLSTHYNRPIDKIEEQIINTETTCYTLALIDGCNRNIYLKNIHPSYSNNNHNMFERFLLIKYILANFNPNDYQILNSNNLITNKKYTLIKKIN